MLGLSVLLGARKSSGFQPHIKRRVRGVLRVGVYVSFLVAVSGFFAYRQARAAVGEDALRVGRDLAPLGDLLSGSNQLDINGQRLFLHYDLVSPDVTTTLDRFAAHCKGGTSPVTQVVSELEAAEAKSPQAHDVKPGVFDSPGYLRRGDGNEGVVVCLVKGKNTADTWRAAVDAFTSTHDLGALGKLRYAFARKKKGGKTLLLTLWTEDRFALDDFLPGEGHEGRDARGTDSKIVPRPPHAQRLVDASFVGRPDVVHVYRSSESPGKLEDFYDEAMAKQGFTVDSPPTNKPGFRVYMKDQASVLLSIGVDSETQGSLASFAELAGKAVEVDVESAK